MNIAHLLVRAGRSFGDQPALALGQEELASYASLAATVERMAGALRGRHGLKPGERVALIMRNSPAYVETLFAIWHAGLVAVPVNAKLHASDFAYILEHSGARVCFVTADLAAAVGGAAARAPELQTVIEVGSADYAALAGESPIAITARDGRNPAWLFYTSGTTGKPKGAMLSHRNLAVMTAGYYTDVDNVQHTNTLLHAAPMSHGSGIYTLPHVAAGARQLVPESGGFDPEEIFGLLEHYSEVSLFAAPTMIKRMTAAAEGRTVRHDHLKTVVYGGGPMYQADIRDAMARFGQCFVQIYGQGESPMTITALAKRFHRASGHPRYSERLASVGIPQALIEVRVAAADGTCLPPGDIGEVQVRGESVMLGYWRNQAATAEAIVDGWLRTGDMGSFDEEGFLTLKDRSKDLIISGGTNIYPREVEEILLLHPGVSEVAVVGIPDREWGESVVAFVVANGTDAVSEKALDAYCLEHMARFKRPTAYRFVDALPKNAYGKVLKTELRKQTTS